MLEPDRSQIERFVAAILRRATAGAYLSLRSFHEDRDKVLFIDAVKLNGGDLTALCAAAVKGARRAANADVKAVFAPPIATFKTPKGAAAKDLAEGLTLSVECDSAPLNARRTLEGLLGEATVVVRSGGRWAAPDGATEDKLHLHWRLAKPAGDRQTIAKLKKAREFACRLAGGDPSNTPIVHPNRWPGSWHRKGEPRLCEIAALDPEREIDLDSALAALEKAAGGAAGAAAPDPPVNDDGWADAAGDRAEARLDLNDAFKKILAGESYHPALTPLAASYAALGAPAPVTYSTLRALLSNSNPRDVERARRRDAELRKLDDTVGSAYVKFGKAPAGDGAADASGETAAAFVWKTIDMNFFSVEIPAPELSHDMLPDGWVDIIWASAFAAGAPPDYVAGAALVAAAGAIGNARVVLASPGWEEVIVLWAALVGAPSAHKSPAMSDTRKALTHIDTKLHAQWRLACDKLEADHEIALAQAQGRKKTIKKPPKPPLAQLLHDDVTLEKLTISMADNPHGALVFYDELASWFSSFSRYSADGDASGARAFWNKAYNAGRHKRDRVKNEGPPIVVEAAACSVLGAIQPDRLRQFWSTANDGMLARLIFIWPRLASPKPIDPNSDPQARTDLAWELKRAYQALYDLKLDAKDGEPRPKALRLAAGALAPFNAAYLACADRARREHGVLAEWLGKGPGRILRLAGVFELMAWSREPLAAEPEEISADAMERAIRYFRHLEMMFRRAIAGIEPGETGNDALAVSRLIVKKGWTHFADRDVGREPGFRWFRGERRNDKERRLNALRTLQDAGAIRREKVKTGGGIFEKWAVHPGLEAALDR